MKRSSSMIYTNTQSIFLSSLDSTKIFYQYWTQENANKVLVIQHGFGEHSDRYKNLLKALEGSCYNIYALDSRGHGRSEGIRGHVDNFGQYVEDLNDLIQIAKKNQNVPKVVLLGHSLGGVIALKYCFFQSYQNNLNALILSAPAIAPKMDFEKELKKTIAPFFAAIVPDLTIDANLDVKLLSRDVDVVNEYRRDKFVHGKISFKMGDALLNQSYEIYSKANKIHVPCLLMHGDADGIADHKATLKLYSNFNLQNKKVLKVYPNLYHEIMNEIEPDRSKVLADIVSFLDEL